MMNTKKNHKKKIKWVLLVPSIFILSAGVFLGFIFLFTIQSIPETLSPSNSQLMYANILDRNGYLLANTRKNSLNLNVCPLWKMPDLLIKSFIIAEDKRFYQHHGVDWLARGRAILANIKAGRIIRGASTITEQCVRIIHPRPRTFYTRIVETFEAYLLENRFTKDEILEYYLNQVPYSHQCRGISQAADYYFNRSLDTLNLDEILTLAVMVRAPTLLNPLQNRDHSKRGLRQRIDWLAKRMNDRGLIPYQDKKGLSSLELASPFPRAGASHFIQMIKNRYPEKYSSNPRLITTLDINLQTKLTHLLRTSLNHLRHRNTKNGAILVLDHLNDEITAWVNGSHFYSDQEGSQIDAILTLRQPGSTLKPFLYALALERGFTAASIIPDTPLKHPVGHGLHSFRNYSKEYYGPMRLRCTLGNSLNIPAIRVIRHLGVVSFLDTLHKLKFDRLNQGVSHYGEGLALGNGEVSLFELVRAYGVLARSGVYRSPNIFLTDPDPSEENRIFSRETCSIISHILSDPSARALEFGRSGLFDFPVQTAVKTGTSTDYRDAWAVGYNYRFTVGVWMGNLDYTPTHEISGSRGPAMVLRSVFQELNRNQSTRPLFLSPGLTSKKICVLSGMAASSYCPGLTHEWFRKEHVPSGICSWHKKDKKRIVTTFPFEYKDWMLHEDSRTHVRFDTEQDHDPIRSPEPDDKTPGITLNRVHMIQPVPGLHLALDPRIPDHLEEFPFEIESSFPIEKIDWYLNRQLIATTGPGKTRYPWRPMRGHHSVFTAVKLKDIKHKVYTQTTSFLVK